MIKLIIFDLDNTLAPINKQVPKEIINKLKKFESKGIRIAIISGKPIYYLSGLSRQLGLQKLILSAENGALIAYSNNFPPKYEVVVSLKSNEKKIIETLRVTLIKTYGDKIRFQHNFVNLTVFPRNKNLLKKVYESINQYLRTGKKNIFSIYVHPDSIEVVPYAISKGRALKLIKSKLTINRDEIIAIGDSEYDTSMQKEAIMIGIKLKNVDYEVLSLPDAILQIETILKIKNSGLEDL